MAHVNVKSPATSEEKQVPTVRSVPGAWRPLDNLRKEVDHFFEELDLGAWRPPFKRSVFEVEPFWRRELNWTGAFAVDIAEKDGAYEIAAELPGLDEKDIEVKHANGMLTIKGEKKEETEEEKKGIYHSERRYGSFERSFRVPEGVDVDKIDARFEKGVLTVTLPKSPEALKAEKKIAVRAHH
jgi:HSP20 family protein